MADANAKPMTSLSVSVTVVFGLSGATGLIYESIWTHYLKLFLGHAAYAQTLVLAIFMSGLALGAWLCSKWSVRWENLLRRYALAEGVIGICALAFHPAFVWLVNLAYADVIPAFSSPWAVSAWKWGLASLLILPQSILLGMTFPLMSGAFVRRFPTRPGASLAVLYFANSLGGAIGALASGFLLIRLLGLPGTLTLAGLVNLGLAGLAWRLGRGGPEPSAGILAQTSERSDAAPQRLMLLIALLTGTASFIYEIGWVRMLSLVLGGSTHAFELMLSAFVLGLALGGLWIRTRIDHVGNPMKVLGLVQVVMGLCAISTLALYGTTFDAMSHLLSILPKTNTGYLQFNVASHAIALAVMLPTTFCAGMTLPLITYVLLQAGKGERSIGAVYAANTVGAIVGVFFAVHIGLPLLGLKPLVMAGAAVDMLLGLLLLWRQRQRGVWGLPLLVSSACCGLAIAATLLFVHLDFYRMASGVYRRSQSALIPGNTQLLFHRDGKTATVDVADTSSFVSIRTNGKIDATLNMSSVGGSAVDETTMVLAGALPLLLHPQARTAANIGMGSGLTTHVLLSTPTLAAVDTIEIEAGMIEGAKHFWPRNARAYTDPRSHLHIDDAKTFFSSHQTRYDIIVSEPSNPWVSGVAGLFSKEFYGLLANRHLADGGIFVQWLQLYEFDLRLLTSVLKALSPNFADYAVYVTLPGDILIVASRGHALPPLDTNAFDQPGVARELNRVGIRGIQDVALRQLADRRLLTPWLATLSVPPNSDYAPLIDQDAPRLRFLEREAGELMSLGNGVLPVLEILSRTPRPWTETAITPLASLPASLNAAVAVRLRDTLRGDARRDDGPPEVENSANRLLERCEASRPGRDRRPILFDLGVALVGFLRPEELRQIWRVLNTKPCATGLMPSERSWWDLFEAIGNRDPREMMRLADSLLTDSAEPLARRRFLFATVRVAELALGIAGRGRPTMRIPPGEALLRSPITQPDVSLLLQILATEDTPTRRIRTAD